MKVVSPKKMGFQKRQMHRKKEPGALYYLSQRTSFWIASFSILAFVVGNMIGQHGWYVVWKSVMGKEQEITIVYTGTVPPVAFVPDYAQWAQYGGDPWKHTYRQVPRDVLVPLPLYDVSREAQGYEGAEPGDIFSIGYMGSYENGREGAGSHPGVDIRMPEGTPVRSIANGVVESAGERSGFGLTVVIRHPDVPDPADPAKVTTLYSAYAHLSSIFVSPGQIVKKAEEIGLSGSTGAASGPHLHFQIDRQEAPWHPYWPFTGADARSAGMTYQQAIDQGLNQAKGYELTIHPLLYVQANYSAMPTLVAASAETQTITKSPEELAAAHLHAMERLREERVAALIAKREERIRMRLAQRGTTPSIVQRTPSPVVPIVQSQSVVASAEVAQMEPLTAAKPANVFTADIQHDGGFHGRQWEKLRIELLDEQGNRVEHPEFSGDMVLRTAFGEAEFDPPVLSSLDFKDGIAGVRMLPRGMRTIVIQLKPFDALSAPMRWEGR